MKAMVLHQYGGPDALKFEDYPDPVPGAGEVLVRVAATSINPIDNLRRSGAAKAFQPVQFPGILGIDLAGTVLKLGSGVEGISVGDRVFAMADHTYAELCVVKAEILARIPEGLDVVEAAALPLVTTTGNQLIVEGTGIKAGQTVLVSGAAGGVGRSAVFTAKDRGAVVIAAVLKTQFQAAESLGADQIVATDGESAMANLPPLDAVASAVGGRTAEYLLGKVKQGGVFGSVLGPPGNAKDHPSVRVVPVHSHADAKTLLYMSSGVTAGKLVISIDRKLPLRQAAEGQAAVEKGGIGKVLLLP
jgi:NADPH:quinone reductase-like Zn-dependent oxidoreductase